ncbi:MAG: TIGR00730 family Rossman fold protein [Balneolales bacterium]|nr:TIGR00730 family Rossman fold protein [Balneolales bacterium]
MSTQKRIPNKYSKELQNNVWSVFKVMGEFVEGYERMFEIGPCVSIFGSARLDPDGIWGLKATEMGKRLTEMGFGVITGGGPGIMEAANKGAKDGQGKSVGLTIRLPFEAGVNSFVDKDYHIDFNYFFARKVMLVKYAQAFIVFPGGLGTLDEFFESLTLMQTGKISRVPVVLIGVDFWKGLTDWMKQTLIASGTINEKDMDLFLVTDSIDEAITYIEEFYNSHKIEPNF